MTLAADAALSGEFTVIYPGVGYTQPLAHDTSAETFASAIRALGSDTGGAITVSRSRTGVRGYAWSVTFDDLAAGDRPQMVAIANASLETRAAGGVLSLDVETVTDGVESIGGAFEIEFNEAGNEEGAKLTGPLSYDVSAREVEVAIEALDGVGDVSVKVELLDDGRSGRVFTVTWPTTRGNVPMLRVNESGLTPTSDDIQASNAALAYVNEVRDRAGIVNVLGVNCFGPSSATWLDGRIGFWKERKTALPNVSHNRVVCSAWLTRFRRQSLLCNCARTLTPSLR